MDTKLATLNFQNLLHYGRKPQARHRYESPLECSGFCVSCEENHLCGEGISLDAMSHGCNTADFVTLLGKMPEPAARFDQHVLFLLEMPPGHATELDEQIEFNGVKKWVPTKHYYWTPTTTEWPDLNDIQNIYGDYFAYLMAKHGLLNTYITNAVKCSPGAGDGARLQRIMGKLGIPAHCMHRYLLEELKIWKPSIVFCFGGAAHYHFRQIRSTYDLNIQNKIELYHPAAISKWRIFPKYRSQREMIEENDRRIASAIHRWKSAT